MRKLATALTAIAAAMLASSASASIGTVFYTSNGITATILEEKPWRNNGFEGYDVYVRVCGKTLYCAEPLYQLYGIICVDYNNVFGPSVRAMSSLTKGGYPIRNSVVQPGGPALRGIDGYDQDLWHNVCYRNNSY